MKFFLLFNFNLLAVLAIAQEDLPAYFDRSMNPQELVSDYELLIEGLNKIHPAIDRYTNHEDLAAYFLKAKSNLNQSLNFADFYKVVCETVAQIKCNHTIATPSDQILNQIHSSGKFFPLRLYWEFDPVAVYAAYDFSSDASLPPATQILSIDGRSIEEIYHTMIPYFPSDGDILTNKQSRLQYGFEFQLWYYLLMERPETFDVTMLVDENEVSKSYTSVTIKEWTRNHNTYISSKDPELKDYLSYWVKMGKKIRSNPIRLEEINDNVSLLTVQNFDSHKFDKIMARSFFELKKKQVGNLIIDVRNNGGGSDIQGRMLFRYLISKPENYFDSLYSSTQLGDTTFLFKHTEKNAEWYAQNIPLVDQMEDGRFATKPETNQGLNIQEPMENAFEGNVYVLMNGRSASTTSEFTSAVHRVGLATFIGEESGGAYHGGNGGDFAHLRLPNSEILVEIPLSKYVMNSTVSLYEREGTIPDYEVTTSMNDILTLQDPQLLLALKLIAEDN